MLGKTGIDAEDASNALDDLASPRATPKKAVFTSARS
jgi:hypothetical protein